MKKQREKENKLKEGLVSALELPRDLACQEAVLTLCGKSELIIENYRQLLFYAPERIAVLTGTGPLEILGERMEMAYYTCDEMKITGQICQLQWKCSKGGAPCRQ